MRIPAIAISVVLLIGGLFSISRLVEYVDANEIVLVQSIGGDMTWYTSPGPVPQWFGKVTSYQKRGTLEFTADKQEGDNGQVTFSNDKRLSMVFNDAGKGFIMGSISYELPLDDKHLTDLHQFYPTQSSLESGLIEPALSKSVYMTGPLMSSYESYKERRTQLIQYVEDQVQNGIYQTQTIQKEVPDDLDPKVMKHVSEVQILTANGQPRRLEDGQLKRFGIRTFNFAIKDLDYDQRVQQQIQQQQQITMQVQTSIAQAKQAEQQKLTAEAEGAANAAKAKWQQETLNAQVVAEAEGRAKAAEQDKIAADYERQATILRAQGEADASRLKIQANGALEAKLETIKDINRTWATAFQNFSGTLVPSVVMGGGGTSGNAASTAQTFMELLTAKTAKDLSLDLSISRTPISGLAPTANRRSANTNGGGAPVATR